jgi:hypothetical protein
VIQALQFDAERHEYRLGTRVLPGVTSVVQQLDELDGIPRDILEAAARFGRHVHKAVELWSRGVLDEAKLDPALVPYLNGWKEFCRHTGAVVIASEQRVWHQKLRYAGTLDSIVRIGRRRHLVDVKSSDKVPRSVGPQTAGYARAYIQDAGQSALDKVRMCVHLRPDGEYRLHKYQDASDWNVFLSCLNIHNFRNRK